MLKPPGHSVALVHQGSHLVWIAVPEEAETGGPGEIPRGPS